VSLAVVDASVLTVFYAATTDHRYDEVVARMRSGDALFAPAHMDAEVISAHRGLALHDAALRQAVPDALHHLAEFPIRRVPLAPLLDRIWELRNNVTPYDAAYVALAERLNGRLVTCDTKLANASGVRCAIDLIA
jgi:predicted nucleic acid-binding protein